MDSHKLSPEELDSFKELFAIEPGDELPDAHRLTVTTKVPELVARLLGKSKLTLLAEVSHYKLFFPLNLHMDEFGQFNPELGIPEVLDTRGGERSWRLTDLDGVVVKSADDGEPLELLSLSSSGVTLREQDMGDSKEVQLELPGGETVPLAVEEVRSENGVVAARILASAEAREALRRFLFGRHRDLYAELYADLAQPKP
ncbi:hypothetical protein KJI95_07290 [Shewanella sp. JM162201]|uniref:PilZ domain-containing protein n=1 Tax=Shewanella jiangmenensis TaxID=2837387 RepID=A0ABS5V1I8_9GAMM|nr:hypothetical protein [Shewanella jiangmenensis]MBT1444329.1 hypothetical protein [Shewanella jiangmenensis]